MNILFRVMLVLLFVINVPIALGFDSKSHSVELYEKLTQVTHLNSLENIQKLDRIIERIKFSEFEGMRAPFFAYGAKISANNGDWVQGKLLLEKAINSLPLLKESNLIIDTYDYISWIYFNRGDYANAIYYVQKMADYGFSAYNKRAQAIALNRLAFSYLELGFNELAIEPLQSALKIARESKNNDTEFLALLYLINARIDFPNAKPKATYKLIESAEAIATPLNKNDGYLPRLKGIVYQQLGDFAKAKSWLEIALNIAKKRSRLTVTANDSS